MSFLTFEPNKNERREYNPPLERMNLIIHARMTLQNVIGLELAAHKSKKEARYGKAQKVGKQFFESDWTNFHNQNALQPVVGPAVITEQPVSPIVPVAEKTILDEDIHIDQYQFDVMANEKRREPEHINPVLTTHSYPTEPEIQPSNDVNTEIGQQNIIDESRKKAYANSTPIHDAKNDIYQGNT